MASIEGIFTSPGRKSGVSVGHERLRAIEGQGMEGCAHANPPRRERLFASLAHLESGDAEPEDAGETLTVEGPDVQECRIGRRVRAGEAVFEIRMVWEPCHRMDEL